MKFGRDYTLTIGVAEQNSAVVFGKTVAVKSVSSFNKSASFSNTIVVSYPLTLEFDIQRSTLASSNTAHFKIYNLKEDTRKRIFKDRYAFNIYRSIVMAAGYSSPGVDVDSTDANNGGNKTFSIVFQGNILSAYSYRVKQDWITEIEALDGGFGQINGQISSTFPASFDLKDVVTNLLSSIPKTAVGVIGELPADQRSRGLTVMGNSWDILNALLPAHQVFIDNEKANVLGQDECIGGQEDLFVINSDSGLLGSPRRYNIQLDVSLILEPQIKVGQWVKLESIDRTFNGLYKVNGVTHRGVISGAVCGEAVTTLSLWKGENLLTGVN